MKLEGAQQQSIIANVVDVKQEEEDRVDVLVDVQPFSISALGGGTQQLPKKLPKVILRVKEQNVGQGNGTGTT
jgi:hypothetical protein